LFSLLIIQKTLIFGRAKFGTVGWKFPCTCNIYGYVYLSELVEIVVWIYASLPVIVMFMINSIHYNTLPMGFPPKISVFCIISKENKQIVFVSLRNSLQWHDQTIVKAWFDYEAQLVKSTSVIWFPLGKSDRVIVMNSSVFFSTKFWSLFKNNNSLFFQSFQTSLLSKTIGITTDLYITENKVCFLEQQSLYEG
jgi:hypothetical protein